MKIQNQKISVTGKNAYAQVMSGERKLITNKKGKFSQCIRKSESFNLFVIRSGFYILSAEEGEIIISKVVSFSEDEHGDIKEKFAVCEIRYVKNGKGWSNLPPKSLERAIRNLEKKN
ncbi:MAG: hypothetical protein PHE89_00860 [Alphaproteobacteria bacterium]|nr:hypothetical protein [Alphaproteobacteria bacterium]